MLSISSQRTLPCCIENSGLHTLTIHSYTFQFGLLDTFLTIHMDFTHSMNMGYGVVVYLHVYSVHNLARVPNFLLVVTCIWNWVSNPSYYLVPNLVPLFCRGHRKYHEVLASCISVSNNIVEYYFK